MKLDSKLFDNIRIRPRREAKPDVTAPQCAWEGCDKPGVHRAPKGHRAEGEYHNFCLEHVRHYNTSFNFFAGMDADAIETHVHESAATNGRPSWGLGAKPEPDAKSKAKPNATRPSAAERARYPRSRKADANRRVNDPLHVFAKYARSQQRGPQLERVIKIHESDRRALETLGFQASAKSDEIKKAYKSLVKIHHPDANGGDKSSEDRLRTIIAAYTHLKTKGFV